MSNLSLRTCPRCRQAVLSTATLCQFCGAELSPTEVAREVKLVNVPSLTKRTNAWHEIANSVLGALWIVAGVFGLVVSILAGPMGIAGAIISVLIVFIGIGIVRQQWLALTIAKFYCACGAVYSLYMLIATPAIQQSNPTAAFMAEHSPSRALVLMLLYAFQAYIFWSVGDLKLDAGSGIRDTGYGIRDTRQCCFFVTLCILRASVLTSFQFSRAS